MKVKTDILIVVAIILTNVLCCGCGDEVFPEGKIEENEQYSFDLQSNQMFEGRQSDEEICNYKVFFSCKVEQFSSLSVGKGKQEYNGAFVTVTEDELLITNNATAATERYTIDIDPQNTFEIVIDVDTASKAEVIVDINNESFSFKGLDWDARKGAVFAEAGENTELTDCSLNYYCKDWKKPIWMMGDSYFNATSEARWTSYLPKDEGRNFLLNGYPGRNSEAAITSLKVMLKYGTPEEIIWCLGMNDGDEGKINESYERAIEELMTICKEKNIELVLSTIPSCPDVNNDYKNEFVKNSGYKYIDFADAVGAYDSVWWDDEMLNTSDEVVCHPTEKGAAAFYEQAINTCPELLDIDVDIQ